MKYLVVIFAWAYLRFRTLKRWPEERRLRKQLHEIGTKAEALSENSKDSERLALMAVGLIILFALTGKAGSKTQQEGSPKLGQYLLYLLLSKKDREYLIGDLDEEYLEVLAKFGRRWADIWYYKQVVASAWPLIRKAAGLGLLASLGAWIRRFI
jgi:hypothetical protein